MRDDGVYDVVVGINLLREGLTEVSLVAIGCRQRVLAQRARWPLAAPLAHRWARGDVYDKVTGSMKRAIDETNAAAKFKSSTTRSMVLPLGIAKAVERPSTRPARGSKALDLKKIPKDEYKHLIKDLTAQMDLAAANLEFEKAAELRDIITDIKGKM